MSPEDRNDADAVTGTRRPRRSRAELRTLLLGYGRRLLLEEGLVAGGDNLTFKKVFDLLEVDTGIRVTNASVIGRIWDNLADYRMDVLIKIARDDANDELEVLVDGLAPVVASMDLTSPEGRWRAVSDLCRVGSDTNLASLTGSEAWALWIAIWALGIRPNDTADQERLRTALYQGYHRVNDHFEELYRSLLGLVGLRVRDNLTLAQFTMAAGSLTEGAALRATVGPSIVRHIMRPTGPDGELEEWTLSGIGIEALARAFFELDPDWVPPES